MDAYFKKKSNIIINILINPIINFNLIIIPIINQIIKWVYNYKSYYLIYL